MKLTYKRELECQCGRIHGPLNRFIVCGQGIGSRASYKYSTRFV